MFKDILTFLGLDFRDVKLTCVLCCPRNQYLKNQINRIIRSYKSLLFKKLKIYMFKLKVRTFW